MHDCREDISMSRRSEVTELIGTGTQPVARTTREARLYHRVNTGEEWHKCRKAACCLVAATVGLPGDQSTS